MTSTRLKTPFEAAHWLISPHDSKQSVECFQRTFSINKPLRSATLHASARGIYAAFCNGRRVGHGVLTPGWTSVRFRLQYQSYDVTEFLSQENVISLGLACGWACGELGWVKNDSHPRPQPALIAELELRYEDDTFETIATDECWQVFSTPVLFAELYHGETVDLSVHEQLIGSAVSTDIPVALIPQQGEWITEHERFAPISVIHTPKGETVLDFGQNLAGYVELHIRGKRGDRVVLHHAEVLDRDGNFYCDNYRNSKNEMTYVLSGGSDVFKPTYTFQGFRYVRLTEYPLEHVDPNDFCAIAVYSDMQRTGYFSCGNVKINQLYHNVLWGQRSNYLDVPTDCPQRDERLGWTGDAQVFARTAAINFDVSRFFDKWLDDVALEQHPSGAVMGIVPDCFWNRNDKKTRISAAWGDAACIIPWELYLAYGDIEQLRKHFPMMKKWVEYIHSAGPEEYLWLGGMHYGDWLAMDAGSDSYVGATSNDLIASAFFAHSTDLLIRAGEALNEDMASYRQLYQNIVFAFRAYFMKNGLPKAEFPYTEVCANGHAPVDTLRCGMTQTALTLILHFNLCTDAERPLLAAKLAEMIRKGGTHLSTGFVGTPYLLHVLSENGYADLAFDLLFQESAPSWLYSVLHGATTMWEHWDGIREDGSFWSSDMNSFNHYAYGSVYDWIFGVAAGIAPAAPGYSEILLAPHPDQRFGFLDASIQTRCGLISVHWYYKGESVYYEFEVPQGVCAHLCLPSGKRQTIGGGTFCFAEPA